MLKRADTEEWELVNAESKTPRQPPAAVPRLNLGPVLYSSRRDDEFADPLVSADSREIFRSGPFKMMPVEASPLLHPSAPAADAPAAARGRTPASPEQQCHSQTGPSQWLDSARSSALDTPDRTRDTAATPLPAINSVDSLFGCGPFQQLKRIYAQLRRTKGDNADLASIVVGNKIDLAAQRAVSADEGRLFASQARCPFMEISAKNKVDVDLVFSTLVRRIRNENKTSDPPRAPPQGGMGSSGSSHSGNTQGAPTGTIGASGAQADAPSAGGAATGQPPSQLPRPKPKEKKWRCVML